MTNAAPLEPDGVVQVTSVGETVTTEQGAPPTVTTAPETNPVPVIERVVEPASAPPDGEIPAMNGAA